MPQSGHRRVHTNSGDETYVEAKINGRPTYCLLDTGCQFSTLPAWFVATADLQPAGVELFTVNGDKLTVLGRTDAVVEIHGKEIPTTFLVSEHVDEIPLSRDFLNANDFRWQFGSGQICIGEAVVPLLPCPVCGWVRRVDGINGRIEC